MNVNRFKQLLESKLGNVRPLLFEQNPTGDTPSQNLDQGKTVKINGKDIPTYNDATKKNATYGQLLSQAYNNQVVDNTGGGVFSKISDIDQSLVDYVVTVTGKKGGSWVVDCDEIENKGNANYGKLNSFVGGPNLPLTDKSKLMFKRYCVANFPKQNFPWKATTPLYDN